MLGNASLSETESAEATNRKPQSKNNFLQLTIKSCKETSENYVYTFQKNQKGIKPIIQNEKCLKKEQRGVIRKEKLEQKNK